LQGADAVRELYRQLIEGWNERSAEGMARPIAEVGLVVGFDGTRMTGPAQVEEAMSAVFADHRPARYVTRVESVTALDQDVAILEALVGMVPPGEDEVIADRNAIQTVVAQRTQDGWKVVLFQNTPVRLDGRPEEAERLTRELNALVR
jgi:uncharacterized protein (TIGR02246 family)